MVTFLERGEDVYRAMCEAEAGLRALELLDLMKAHGKA